MVESTKITQQDILLRMAAEWKQQSPKFQVKSQSKEMKFLYFEPPEANGTFVQKKIKGLTVEDFRKFFANYAE